MKHLSIILLLTAFVYSNSYAQWEPQKSFSETYAYGCDPAVTGYQENPVCGVVIALSGLKLRISPSFSAKTIAVIPFGETVARTEKGYDLKPYGNIPVVFTPDSIRGYWQEITWRDKKGFAFSAYIGDAIYKMKDEGYLLFESEWLCWNDCYANPSYNYYGVFTNRDSSRWEMHQIKPSFVHNDESFPGTMIKSNSKKPPAFIFVSKKPLMEGLLLTGGKSETIFHRSFDTAEKEIFQTMAVIPFSQFSIAAKTVVFESENRINLILTEKSTGRQQVLGHNFYAEIVELSWSGDIDQDGIMDFILTYTGDHVYACQLFLSSAAHGSQLVKPLKIYWYGDCC